MKKSTVIITVIAIVLLITALIVGIIYLSPYFHKKETITLNFRITNRTKSTIDVAWKLPSENYLYGLRYKLATDTSWSTIPTNDSGSTFKFTQLNNNTKYMFQLNAILDNKLIKKEELTASTNLAPGQVLNPRTTPSTNSTILSFTPVSSATKYTVKTTLAPITDQSVWQIITSNLVGNNVITLTIDKLISNRQYGVQIISFNDSNDASAPVQIVVSTLPRVPDDVKLLINKSWGFPTQFVIYWIIDNSPWSEVDAFQVQYRVSGGDNQYMNLENNPEKTDSLQYSVAVDNLTAKTKYDFRVLAINSVGQSPGTSPDCMITAELPDAVGDPVVETSIVNEAGDYTISWKSGYNNSLTSVSWKVYDNPVTNFFYGYSGPIRVTEQQTYTIPRSVFANFNTSTIIIEIVLITTSSAGINSNIVNVQLDYVFNSSYS